MAKESKKDPAEFSVEEKLKALYQLQTMLSEIDKIKTLRGELPLEVQDLEDELAGLNTRIEKIKGEITDLTKSIADSKVAIERSKSLIAKYTEQQDNVRNNREFDALNKEIEYQNLNVELAEKHIRDFSAAMNAKNEELQHSQELISENQRI
jgi:predicted  nucleic acid-binding Zn-ribbon protein